MHTHYYVLHCPRWEAYPNGCALVRQYPDDDAIYWGIAYGGDATPLPWPPSATILHDYGCIDDALIADQEAIWIDAMCRYMTPERSGTLAEGWLSPDGRFYACAGPGLHEELALRLCAYVYDTIGAGETLERAGWLQVCPEMHERAAAWMADYRLTPAQRRAITGWYHTADSRWEVSLEPFLFDA